MSEFNCIDEKTGEVTTTNIFEQKGSKFDGDKVDLTLLPYPALRAMARGFMYGEKKYGRNNFRLGGYGQHRLLAAALRHIFAHLEGEKVDQESGNTHLAHAICSLAMHITLDDEGKL